MNAAVHLKAAWYALFGELTPHAHRFEPYWTAPHTLVSRCACGEQGPCVQQRIVVHDLRVINSPTWEQIQRGEGELTDLTELPPPKHDSPDFARYLKL